MRGVEDQSNPANTYPMSLKRGKGGEGGGLPSFCFFCNLVAPRLPYAYRRPALEMVFARSSMLGVESIVVGVRFLQEQLEKGERRAYCCACFGLWLKRVFVESCKEVGEKNKRPLHFSYCVV